MLCFHCYPHGLGLRFRVYDLVLSRLCVDSVFRAMSSLWISCHNSFEAPGYVSNALLVKAMGYVVCNSCRGFAETPGIC